MPDSSQHRFGYSGCADAWSVPNTSRQRRLLPPLSRKLSLTGLPRKLGPPAIRRTRRIGADGGRSSTTLSSTTLRTSSRSTTQTFLSPRRGCARHELPFGTTVRLNFQRSALHRVWVRNATLRIRHTATRRGETSGRGYAPSHWSSHTKPTCGVGFADR